MSLARASAGVFTARALGLLSAFGFNVYLAHRFGGDRHTDAAFAALVIPQAMVAMLGTLLPPVFASHFKAIESSHGVEEARVFGRSAAIAASVLAAAATGLGLLLSPWLSRWVGGGLERSGNLTELMRLAFLLVVLTAVASVLKGLLNGGGSFFAPSLDTLVMNCVAAAAVWFGAPYWGVSSLVAGLVAGSVARVALMAPGSFRLLGGFSGGLYHPGLIGVGRGLLPLVGTGILHLVGAAVVRGLATRSGQDGALSHFIYAERLLSAPQDILGVSLGIVLLPSLAAAASSGDFMRVRQLTTAGLRMCFFIGVPAATGLAILAEPLVAAIYEHGSFDASDRAATAQVLVGFSPSLAFSGSLILQQGFYAFRRTMPILLTGLVIVSLNIVLSLLLVGPWGTSGLSWAYTFSFAAGAAVSLVFYSRMAGHPDLAGLALGGLGVLLCSLGMGFCVWSLRRWGGAPLGIQVAVGIAVYGALARCLCRTEWGLIRRLWSRSEA